MLKRSPSTHHPPPTIDQPSPITHLQPLLLWTLIWLLFFATILLGWERLPSSDFSGQFDAFARHQAREMLSGRLPLWSEGSFGGIPFVADVQAAVFYLPRWLTIFASAPWGFSYYALELEALFHIWLTGVFVYFLVYDILWVEARHLSPLRRKLVRWIALFPAVAFSLGGYLTSYPLLQLAILETFTWLPLTLLLIRKATTKTSHTSTFILHTSLSLALAFTAGHPQTFLHISYVAAFYYLFRSWQAGWTIRQILGNGLLIGVVAIGASAAAWLPVLTYLPLTVRAEVSYDFVSTGETIINYLQLVLPGLFTLWSPQFVGVSTLLLAVVAWRGSRGAEKRRSRGEVWFWGVMVILGAWLSLGDKGILFEGWYAIAPGFSLFRQQERLIGVVVFSLSVLAGMGLLRTRADVLRPSMIVVGGLLLFTAVVALVAPHAVAVPWGWLWMRQAAFLAAAFFVLRFVGTQRTVSLLVLIGLLAAELYMGTYAGLNRTAGSPAVFWPQPPWLETLRAEPTLGRIDPGFLFFTNMGEAYDLESVRGISPLKPQLLADLEGRLPLGRLWPLLNVTHGLFTAEAPADVAATPIATVNESLIPGEPLTAVLYRFEAAQPRVWLADEPVVVADDAAALDAIAAPEFDPTRQVVLLEETAALYTVEPSPQKGTVTMQRPHDGLLDITVDTPTAAYLVISEWHMLGWQAMLNGEVVTLHKGNYAFQTIFIPAGSHQLTVEFAPRSVTIGMMMSVITLLGVVGFMGWTRGIKRN